MGDPGGPAQITGSLKAEVRRVGQREATWEGSLLTIKVENGHEPGHAVGSGRGEWPSV